MRLILDSSVALKTALPETDSAIAAQLINDYHSGIHELLAPDVFYVEVGHSLTRAERQNRILPGSTWGLWKTIMADCPHLIDSLPLMSRAIEISSSVRIGLYDCLYVALAEQEGCHLITADEKLIKNLPGYPIVSLSSF
jgi:predicted nucleic acid-binding protein